MKTTTTLTAGDLDAITAAIGDGLSAVDSWRQQSAGGDMIDDGAREYWAHLQSFRSPAGCYRVARVTVHRDAAGRWRIGDVDILETTTPDVTIDRNQAAEIVAAVEADARRIVREHATA